MSDATNDPPFSNGANGDGDRNTNGTFRKGWKGGPGSPVAKHARDLRQRLDEALFKACAPDRLLAAIDACLKRAEAGDVAALKLLVERIAGPPINVEIAERLESLEALLRQENENG